MINKKQCQLTVSSIWITLSTLFVLCQGIKAQDSLKHQPSPIIYTGLFNRVPPHCKWPLLGFINIAQGSQKNVHIGFINYTQLNFTGLQTGFINVNGLNTSGLQTGFVNISGKKTKGAQMGFVNVSGSDVKGLQLGYINTAKTLTGLQIGFFNYADSVQKGLPIGFVSWVKKGGVRAFKLGMNEMYPLNASFDIGVKSFYTSFIASFNPSYSDAFSAGLGIGSIYHFTPVFYVNPEASIQETAIQRQESNRLISLRPLLGLKLGAGFDLLAGPSFVWQSTETPLKLIKPFYFIQKTTTDSKNVIITGLSVSVRYHLTNH